jgi:hypothetical protein
MEMIAQMAKLCDTLNSGIDPFRGFACIVAHCAITTSDHYDCAPSKEFLRQFEEEAFQDTTETI